MGRCFDSWKIYKAVLNEIQKIRTISIDEIYVPFDNLIVEMMGGDLGFDDFVAKVNTSFKINVDVHQMKGVLKKSIVHNSGMIDLLKELSKRYTLVMLSDIDPVTVESMKIDHWEIFSLFEKKFFSFEVGFLKPDTRFFQYALSDLKVSPDECVFVDDKMKNVDSARQCGMHAIQYISNEQLKSDLISLGIHL